MCKNTQKGERKERKKNGQKILQSHTFLSLLLTGLISLLLLLLLLPQRSTMTREDDLYRALGLERTASQEEIRKAYKTTGAFYLRKKFRLSRGFFLLPRRGVFRV